MDSLNIILALVGSTSLTAVVTHFFNRKRSKVEIEKIRESIQSSQVSSAIELVEASKNLYKELVDEREELKVTIRSLEDYNEKLKAKLVEFENGILVLKSEIQNLRVENRKLHDSVLRLESENSELRKELQKFMNS